jgi:hypothetical protein
LESRKEGRNPQVPPSRIHALTGLIYVSVPAFSRIFGTISGAHLQVANAAAGNVSSPGGLQEQQQLCLNQLLLREKHLDYTDRSN